MNSSVDPRLCQSMSQFIRFDSKFNLHDSVPIDKQSDRSLERRHAFVNRSYNNFLTSTDMTKAETAHQQRMPSQKSLKRNHDLCYFSNTKSNTRNSEVEIKAAD